MTSGSQCIHLFVEASFRIFMHSRSCEHNPITNTLASPYNLPSRQMARFLSVLALGVTTADGKIQTTSQLGLAVGSQASISLPTRRVVSLSK